MNIKLKTAMLLVMFAVATFLFLLPEKPAQANVYILTGNFEVVDGLWCCQCPGNRNNCGCGFDFTQL